MLRMRALLADKGPSVPASTTLESYPDTTMTRATCLTVWCAPATARSRNSQRLALSSRWPWASTGPGKSISRLSGSGGPQSGMLRTAVGVVTTFNAPDATNGTFGASINRAGGVTGLYFDLNNISHGFRRSVAGAPGAFNVPGAGTGAYQGTYPNSISDKGTIAGWFRDANNAVHGFLMLPPM